MSVPALCAAPKVLIPLADGCGLTMPGHTDMGKQHKRRWVRIARVETRGTYLPFAHHDCICNQEIALRNRVLGAVPTPTEKGVLMLKEAARELCRLLPQVSPDDWYVMPNMCTGSKRQRYTMATDRVLSGGLTPKDANVEAFIKFEKKSFEDGNADPRMIQFRSAKYCVALARYLKPCEHRIYPVTGDGSDFPATRFIGKGLSLAARAALLVQKLKGFVRPVVLSLDQKRFDQHVHSLLLLIEFMVYRYMCNHDEFRRLLHQQLVTRGRTTQDIRYVATGGRKSGDFNTAVGNSLLTALMGRAFMRGRKYDMLLDGDDCLLIIEHEDLEWVLANVKPTFLEFGMECKIENVSETIEGVEWCQCHPIQYEPGKYKFVRNPFKVFSTAMSGVKYVDSDKARRKLIHTIGMAEMVLNLGVPVMQAFAEAMMRNAATNESIVFQETDDMYYRVGLELQAMGLKQLERLAPKTITDCARESFARAFGVSIEMQLELEQFFSSWTFTVCGTEDLGPDIDVATWRKTSFSTREACSLRE